MLRIYVNYKQNDCDQHLPTAKFAYNNLKQTSSDMSPFYLSTGQNSITFTTLLHPDNKILNVQKLMTS